MVPEIVGGLERAVLSSVEPKLLDEGEDAVPEVAAAVVLIVPEAEEEAL